MVDETLVDKIVARVLALMSGESVDTSARNVLMLFSGASTGFVVGREAIKRLANSKHSLTVVLTPSAGHIITEAHVRQAGADQIIGPGEWAHAPKLVQQSDLVLIPTLSMNLAARLSLGLMDSLISTVVIGSLLAGKNVVAVKDGADPNGNGGLVFGAVAGTAPALRATLDSHLNTLASYGIELVGEKDFLFTVERRLITRGKPQPVEKNEPLPPSFMIGQPPAPAEVRLGGEKVNFVTATELLSLQPGSVLRLTPGNRLTPQAQDTARRLNLKLVFE